MIKKGIYLRNTVTRELTDTIRRDCTNAVRAIPLMLAARHPERICNHATNVVQDAIYAAEAKLIKQEEET